MNRPLLIVISVVFVDLLGFSLVLPLMPFYADRFGASDTVIGFLVGTYALGQFFATPWLGRLSDRWGRRPILLASVLGSILGFLMWAFAEPLGSRFFPEDVAVGALAVIFLSRILDGVSGGNISVAQAYITDVTTDQERARGLGLVGAAFGLGFILGPPLGGWLSLDGDFARPAFVAAGLATLNLLAIFFFLPESRKGVKQTTSYSILPVAAIRDGLKRPRVGLLLWVGFFYFMAFSTFTSIFSLYTLRRFSLTADANGILLGFVGIMIVLTQAILVGRITRKYGESRLLRFGMPFLGLCMLGWGLAPDLETLVVVLVVTPVCAGTLNVSLRSTLTRVVEPDEVGTMLGVQASLESLTRAIGPVLGAVLIDNLGTSSPGVFAFLTLTTLAAIAQSRLKDLPDSHPVAKAA